DILGAGQVRLTIDPGTLVDAGGKPVAGQAQMTVLAMDPKAAHQNMVTAPVEGGDEQTPFETALMTDIGLSQNTCITRGRGLRTSVAHVLDGYPRAGRDHQRRKQDGGPFVHVPSALAHFCG
ncbi:MAG TPA: hypothetical protein PK156_07090, partial [Polyangium sp.]|nr:hypothetical protein [Polyangium sp.]